MLARNLWFCKLVSSHEAVPFFLFLFHSLTVTPQGGTQVQWYLAFMSIEKVSYGPVREWIESRVVDTTAKLMKQSSMCHENCMYQFIRRFCVEQLLLIRERDTFSSHVTSNKYSGISDYDLEGLQYLIPYALDPLCHSSLSIADEMEALKKQSEVHREGNRVVVEIRLWEGKPLEWAILYVFCRTKMELRSRELFPSSSLADPLSLQATLLLMCLLEREWNSTIPHSDEETAAPLLPLLSFPSPGASIEEVRCLQLLSNYPYVDVDAGEERYVASDSRAHQVFLQVKKHMQLIDDPDFGFSNSSGARVLQKVSAWITILNEAVLPLVLLQASQRSSPKSVFIQGWVNFLLHCFGADDVVEAPCPLAGEKILLRNWAESVRPFLSAEFNLWSKLRHLVNGRVDQFIGEDNSEKGLVLLLGHVAACLLSLITFKFMDLQLIRISQKKMVLNSYIFLQLGVDSSLLFSPLGSEVGIMGRVAAVSKSRKFDTRVKSKKRAQRSATERSKRLAEDTDGRKVKMVTRRKALPGTEDSQLLKEQIGQACRIAAPSRDLCALIRSYAGINDVELPEASRKRSREEAVNISELEKIADKMIQLQKVAANEDEADDENDSESDVETIFVDVMQNEYGQRTLYTLLTALKAVGSKKFDELARALIEEFEENENLSKNHIACRLMSALSFHGSENIRQRVLSVFQHQVSSEEDLVVLLRNNHTSTTIANLLKNQHEDTSKWLSETLSLEKAYKGNSEEDIAQRIATLIEDPVASRVMRQLINTRTRAIFFKYLDISALMNSKRGSAFLRDLFTFENGKVSEEEVASLTSAILERIGDELNQLALDKRANFVVQKIITLTQYGGSIGADAFNAILRLLSSSIPALITSTVGVHVVCTLAETALHISPGALQRTADYIINRNTINDLLFCSNGSLAIRSIMPIVKDSSIQAAALLKRSIEQSQDDLIFHPIGNLVVQRYYKEIGSAAASVYAKKVVKDQKYFMGLCRDNYASHVVYSLLDCVDASTHTLICSALKNNSKALAVHVNGRFLIEKIIPANSDLRNELTRQFVPLCMEKGTQHILCSLVSSLDQRGVESLIAKLTANLKTICTDQSGSITIQKLMQAHPPVREAVASALRASESLRQELSRNFFGKFETDLDTSLFSICRTHLLYSVFFFLSLASLFPKCLVGALGGERNGKLLSQLSAVISIVARRGAKKHRRDKCNTNEQPSSRISPCGAQESAAQAREEQKGPPRIAKILEKICFRIGRAPVSHTGGLGFNPLLVHFFTSLTLVFFGNPSFLRVKKWTSRGLNPRPPVCETGALPLSYTPNDEVMK
eukprot:gene4860-3481_t